MRAETCPCFAGGSLYPGSRGHNVAEATVAGCSVLVGSHHETFKSMIDDINEEDKEQGEDDDDDDDEDDDDDDDDDEDDDDEDGDEDDDEDDDDVENVGVVGVDDVVGGGDGRQVKKVCEVVTCEEELCRGVEVRLDDAAFAAASASLPSNVILATFVAQAIPFIGFGFMDNAIMICAGEYIEMHLGAAFALSTMAGWADV